MAVGAGLAPEVGCHIFGEHPKAAPDQAYGAVWMPTGASPRYFAEPSLETWEKPGVNLSMSQLGHVVGDRREPEDAWSALAGTLIGQIADDPG